MRKRLALIGASLFLSGGLLAQTTSRTVWEGVYTEEQAKSGAAIYARECSGCHGINMEGGEQAPPLTGGAFMSNWNELTCGDLMERLRISMPLNTPGSLPRDDYADVIAHILKFNAFPAGPTKLDRRTEILRSILIVAKNPNS
jgi:cytochrome c